MTDGLKWLRPAPGDPFDALAMAVPPEPAQAVTWWREYNGQIVVPARELGKHQSFSFSPGDFVRSRREDYEFRPVSFMSFRAPPIRLDVGPEWEALRAALARLEAYADFGIGCEMRDWEDRANKEDCWRDWWKTGKSWIRPTQHEGGCDCDPFGDSFLCSDDCASPCEGCR